MKKDVRIKDLKTVVPLSEIGSVPKKHNSQKLSTVIHLFITSSFCAVLFLEIHMYKTVLNLVRKK